MSSLPSATVLVLNYNGEQHLRACLPSLDALDYPSFTVTVVDNGSRDGSIEYVRRHHARTQVLELGANRGFAAAYNAAVRHSSTELVAILNNDTHVAPSWLSELASALERHSAVAVSSAIVDWNGARIDFAGALPTFVGHSWQLDHGEPAGRDYPERPMLFASGGSMLVKRDAFLDAGGFDEDYFAYFEDVDLGWRMNLLGGRIVFAPKALTYHRLHGTASAWGHPLRLRLYERNALATIYKNYGDEALARVLPAAVALALARGLHHRLPDEAAIAFGKVPPKEGRVPAPMVSTLIALEDFSRSLAALTSKRRDIQSRRTVSDEQIFALFPDPLRLHAVSDIYQQLADTLIRDFRIGELFGLPSRPRQLVVPPAPLTHGTTSGVDRGVVSVIVLTASGPRHLPECLDALRTQTWPRERTEVIVVDNGSSEDPRPIVERHYPGATVVLNGRNLGFARGNNAGAKAAKGNWLVFLNDDTRVAPDWLERLVSVAERRHAASVGALIVDWDGTHVDFGGGLLNLEGRGYSVGHGLPIAGRRLAEEPLLFACGAAVLFRRDVFDEIGGWDEGTFAYYEDVEIGWRLWLLGHEIWFAPDAVVHHKHHGTSGSGSAARQRALDRNALRMLYTHLEDRTLDRVLPAALLLASDRVLLSTPFSRASDGHSRFRTVSGRMRPRLLKIRLLHALSRRGARRELGVVTNLRIVGIGGLLGAAVQVARELASGWDNRGARQQYLIERAGPGTPTPDTEAMPIQAIATLAGIADVFATLPALSDKRAWLQAHRKRSDAEILQRFGANWRSPVPSPALDLHQELRSIVLDALGLVERS